MMKILVNAQGLILINDQPSGIAEVKSRITDFVDNSNRAQDPNLSEDPTKAIVSLKTDRATPYSIYIALLDEVRGAYMELWDVLSMQNYGVRYNALDNDRRGEIRKVYPMAVSEAEPDQGSN